jgi:serine/threonine protein kinase
LGTPFYLPIEILTGEKYSSKCDVFSVGIVLYEMMYGKHPFYADKKISSISQLVGELKKNNVNYKYEN